MASATTVGRCNCPAPAHAFLLLHRPPAIHSSFAPLQDQHCRKNGIIATPLFAALVGAPLVGGDARCQQASLPNLDSPTNRLSRAPWGVKSVPASASGYTNKACPTQVPLIRSLSLLLTCSLPSQLWPYLQARQLWHTPAKSGRAARLYHIPCKSGGHAARLEPLRCLPTSCGRGACLSHTARHSLQP